MSKRTRYSWMAALAILALGYGELVAFEGLTPRAKALLGSDHSRAVLKAGDVIARNLPALVFAGAQQAAGSIVLAAVRQTSQLYRLAQGAPRDGAQGLAELGCAKAAEACVNSARIRSEVRTRRVRAFEAAEWNAEPCTEKGCPLCPSTRARKNATSTGAPADWAGYARALVIVKI